MANESITIELQERGIDDEGKPSGEWSTRNWTGYTGVPVIDDVRIKKYFAEISSIEFSKPLCQYRVVRIHHIIQGEYTNEIGERTPRD